LSAPEAGTALGSAATLQRIAEARSSAATAEILAALPFHNFAELLRARAARGNADFLIWADGETRQVFSYRALLDRVAARMARLRQLGVQRGSRIATLFHNHPEAPITCLAAWGMGAAVAPLNAAEEPERLAQVLRASRAALLLFLPEYRALAAKLRALSREAGEMGEDGGEGEAPWRALEAGEDPPALLEAALAGPAPEAGDLALLVFTSGTTGAPKAVLLEQRNLLADADALRRWHGLGETSRLMCVLPVHHVNGLVVTLITPFLSGCSTVLCRRFQTQDFWRRIADEGVHIVSVVPTLLAFLMEDAAGAAGLDLRRFRYLICGAGPLTVELAQRFEERFGFRILHGYGLSETTCYSCMMPRDLEAAGHMEWMRAHGFPAIGTPLPVNEMAIHSAEGRALPEGERGEIVIRGVNVMRGYAERPGANAESFAHGWFRSGDEGFFRRDATGRPFFFITGRIKELIIRGGVNISPFEIDEVLNNIPGVARGLAVGFENRWYGEEVGACVLPEPGAALSESAVLEACQAALPFAKAPKVVRFVSELPATATGKYQRGKLRPLFDAFSGQQFSRRQR